MAVIGEINQRNRIHYQMKDVCEGALFPDGEAGPLSCGVVRNLMLIFVWYFFGRKCLNIYDGCL